MKKLRRFDPGQEGMRVGDVWIDARSRDDIPKLLGGLRDVYLNVELREAVFRLLEERIGGDGNRDAVGPGVSLWTIFVLGVLKRRLGCDFDRLHEHANTQPRRSPWREGPGPTEGRGSATRTGHCAR